MLDPDSGFDGYRILMDICTRLLPEIRRLKIKSMKYLESAYYQQK
jgi:hypothetical protein